MEWSTVARNWAAFMPAMQTRWPEADEEELAAIDGDRERLVAHLAETGERSTADAAEDVARWLNGEIPADARMDPELDRAAMEESGSYMMPGEDPLAHDDRFGDDDVPDRPMGRREE